MDMNVRNNYGAISCALTKLLIRTSDGASMKTGAWLFF